MSTKDLSKEGLRRLIQDNLDLLCQYIKGTVGNQWACVILLMQFIEYLLKYKIQSYGSGFPREHNLKKLYSRLRDDDRNRIETCFGKLKAYNQPRHPESFDTIEKFVKRYHNSYTFLRYNVLQENFSTTEKYFYVVDTFLVLIALMKCSDIDFNVSEAYDLIKRGMEPQRVLKNDITV